MAPENHASPEADLQSTAQVSGKATRVAAFTGGIHASPRRYRVWQYIQPLRAHAVAITEYVARFGSWPPSNKRMRPFWLAATLLDRVSGVAKSHSYDLTLLQREMVSTLATLERFTRRPRTLDVDDAVWLNRRAEKTFPVLAKMCDSVICGNDFIAEHVQRWNRNTFILPTAVDTDKFRPLEAAARHTTKRIIGWSGVSFNLQYLVGIESALAQVLEKRKDVVLRIVSNDRPEFKLLDPSKIEYIAWTPENEVQTIQEMSVGLMPLEDSDWGRGKCSYKMLLYMACGIPVVVSPVGMNNQVLSMGRVGFGAHSEVEWVDSLLWLLDNPGRATEMGSTARDVVEKNYSVRNLAPRLASYLKSFSR